MYVPETKREKLSYTIGQHLDDRDKQPTSYKEIGAMIKAEKTKLLNDKHLIENGAYHGNDEVFQAVSWAKVLATAINLSTTMRDTRSRVHNMMIC